MVDRFCGPEVVFSGGRVWCEVTTIMVLVKTLLKLCSALLYICIQDKLPEISWSRSRHRPGLGTKISQGKQVLYRSSYMGPYPCSLPIYRIDLYIKE